MHIKCLVWKTIDLSVGEPIISQVDKLTSEIYTLSLPINPGKNFVFYLKNNSFSYTNIILPVNKI